MRRVTKVLSATKDAVKNIALSLYFERDEELVIDTHIRSEKDAKEAALQMMTELVFDPKSKDDLEPLKIDDYSRLTQKWLWVLLSSIWDTLKFRIEEELGNAIHEDMESLWVKIEKLEERVKEMELKA